MIKNNFDFPVHYITPTGGLYFWVALPDKAKTGFKSRVFQQALKKKVIYVPGEICYADDPYFKKPTNELRISFGYSEETDISAGIKRLGDAIRESIS